MAYKLSLKAGADFETIYDYSLREFGRRQADIYMSGLVDVFEMLAANSLAGKAQNYGQLGVRCFFHARHSVFYIPDQDEVLIVRILHQAQDPARHLS